MPCPPANLKRFDAVTAPAFSNRPNVSSAVRDSQLQKSQSHVGTSSPRSSAASCSSRSSRPMPPNPNGFRLRPVSPRLAARGVSGAPDAPASRVPDRLMARHPARHPHDGLAARRRGGGVRLAQPRRRPQPASLQPHPPQPGPRRPGPLLQRPRVPQQPEARGARQPRRGPAGRASPAAHGGGRNPVATAVFYRSVEAHRRPGYSCRGMLSGRAGCTVTSALLACPNGPAPIPRSTARRLSPRHVQRASRRGRVARNGRGASFTRERRRGLAGAFRPIWVS